MKPIHFFLLLIITFTAGCSLAQKQQGDLSALEFSQLLNEKKGVVVDIRTPEEYKTGHIPGAVNINYYDEDFLQNLQNEYSIEKPLFIYCASANRSTKAMILMKKNGFTEVYNLLNGIPAWTKEGLPTE
ncbi:MAG: rhodanese-like domain-containing protein [Bacteroidota bacterium]|nr:rhodanese-like domain-containing protein [Bacteroidota bacterium]